LCHLEAEDDAAALTILLLMIAGFGPIDHLRTSARIDACLEACHRNCLPIARIDREARRAGWCAAPLQAWEPGVLLRSA
jgi:hypothetical protein